MVTDSKENQTDDKPKEIQTLSQNPLILKAAEKISDLIEFLNVQPGNQLESTLGYEVKILG